MYEGLLGGLIGALAVVLANWLAGRQTASLEREKWQKERDETFATELRRVVSDLASEVAKAAHSMCWLTWLAKRGPQKLAAEHLAEYDREIHQILPRIVGLHAVLAGMDRQLHKALQPVVDSTYTIDGAIGTACLQCQPGNPQTAAALADQLPEAQQLVALLATKLKDAMEPYAHKAA